MEDKNFYEEFTYNPTGNKKNFSSFDIKKLDSLNKIKDDDEIILERTSKSGNIIEYNIREMIQEINVTDDKKIVCIISNSSSANLNPRVLLKYILDKALITHDDVIKITKLETFNMDENGNITTPI